MTVEEKIARAKELAIAEADRENPRVPAHVPELMALVAGSPIGGWGLPVLKAFVSTYQAKIAATPVPL